jgi:hypothetical protein
MIKCRWRRSRKTENTMNTLSTPSTIKFGLLVLLSATIAGAEPVLAPASGSASAPVAAESKAGGGTIFGKSLFQSAQDPALPLAKWGPVAARPHFLYRYLHANGLLNPQQREDDSSAIHTISPGVLFELGRAATFDYTYSRTSYSNPFFKSEEEHDTRVTGVFRRQKWSLAGSGRYTSSAPILVETARQTPQEAFVTDVDFVVHVGDRIVLTTGATSTSRKVNQIPLDPQWTTTNWDSWIVTQYLDYQISPRFEIGLGYSAGYDAVKPGADMTHTQPQGRLSWRATDKIAVSLTAGIEQRTFKGGRGSTLENPVYQATLQYAPLRTTKLIASGNRSFSASYFANWATRSLVWSGGIEQRLLKRFYLNAAYGEHETSYVLTSLAAYLNRTDKTKTVTARLTTAFIQRGSISLIYQNGRNTSTTPGYSFDNDQVGVETTYRF